MLSTEPRSASAQVKPRFRPPALRIIPPVRAIAHQRSVPAKGGMHVHTLVLG